MADFAYSPLAGATPDPGRRGQLRLLVAALALVGAVTAAAALAAILAPGIRQLLLQEDGIVETGTVIFLAAAVLGAAASTILRGARFAVVLAGLIGLAEFLDETSFGSRLFGLQPLPLYGGGQLDGFHDLLILAFRLLQQVSHNLAWLLVALVLALSAGLVLFAARQIARNMAGTTGWLSGHALLFLHVGFIGLAQAIDIATSSRALAAVEEVLEMNAAILLAFYVVQVGWGRASARPSW
ncbi:hypothetical protein ACFFTN_14540 [Aminobacter aganoensis]|uniref:Uncharacterized protein n=1 Tax=Aminobacter aganoensis TaxID=83264 RepID=A0A7X0FA32_9HYPH|nr:hypothetical protein [Aminobacter aganoensis]MBB6355923.1 hypothetical protein [Aminobacter aganoensis]